ncbi:GALNT12, partial [Symbiodinium sp. CCMP2456]
GQRALTSVEAEQPPSLGLPNGDEGGFPLECKKRGPVQAVEGSRTGLMESPGWCVLALCLWRASALRPLEPLLEDDGTHDDAMWGDKFGSNCELLRKLDLAWFLLVAALALAVLCFQPACFVGAEPAECPRSGEAMPPWYNRFFASLSSHATGIVSFVGFQKIVVARIVATSQPDMPWSLPNLLLYTSILLSITAVFTSIVFLGVDYLRRLAIDSSHTEQLRLELETGKLERTGLGAALILLAVVMLLLYLVVIFTEDVGADTMLLFERVGTCATVVLYLVNLRGLCASPKVQFHLSYGKIQEDISLKEFLQQRTGGSHEGHGDGLRDCIACFCGALAGKDLALFIRMGSRRAFFPGRSFAPVAHVVCVLLFFGAVPGIFQVATEQLFKAPEVVDVQAHSAVLLPGFQPGAEQSEYLLLMAEGAPGLQVKPKYEQTSRVSLCCENVGNCTHQPFEHSLIRFDERPAALKVPTTNSTNCNLTIRGLSRHAVTEIHLRAVLASEYHLCGCTQTACRCCDSYNGTWDDLATDRLNFSGMCIPAECSVKNSNRRPGPECKCKDRFQGSISWKGAVPSGHCTPAPCEIENSNNKAGEHCACGDGYAGAVSWNGDDFTGNCTPANCSIPNSSGGRGWNCRCGNEYHGNISWVGQTPSGTCTPAPCHAVNSNMQPGTACRCTDGYSGTVKWTNGVAEAACDPAPCDVENSNKQPGKDCACLDGYEGNISWHGPDAKGSCRPAQCAVANTTGQGLACRCRDSFEGEITWKGAVAHGRCRPADCNVKDSNNLPGHACTCLEGFDGEIEWDRSEAKGRCYIMFCWGNHSNNLHGPECGCKDGFAGKRGWTKNTWSIDFEVDCRPAECSIPNSNGKPGEDCRCLDGYEGSITWKGQVPQGSCEPAPCQVPYSNMEAGPACACLDGFRGNISWKGLSATGKCMPVPCRIQNSDLAAGPACRCLKGFYGNITWNGTAASGACLPMPLCPDAGEIEVYHATSLKAPYVDMEGSCEAGQPMLIYGDVCDEEEGYIQWRAAVAKTPGKCSWSLNSDECGEPTASEYFDLPITCSAEPGLPRCDSEIEYSVTSHDKDLDHSCARNGSQSFSFTKYQGRQCGFDLIQWESVTVPPPGHEAFASPSSAPCSYKLSTDCGVTFAKQLPRACAHVSEPALFELVIYDVKSLYKLFDSGEFTKTDSDSLIAADREIRSTWHSDGRYLSLQTKGQGQVGFRCQDDGSAFVSADAGRGFRYRLTAPWPLPSWWTFKFQQQGFLPGTFNTDRLVGCKVAFRENKTCYIGMLGQDLWVTSTQYDCMADRYSLQIFKRNQTAKRYVYISSAYGVQTYRSHDWCAPTAAFQELQLEVVDVHVPREEYSHTILATPCRTTIRYLLNATAQEAQCRNVYKDIYDQIERSATGAGPEGEHADNLEEEE